MKEIRLNESIKHANVLIENKDNLRLDAETLLTLDLADAVLILNEKNAELKQKLDELACIL